MSDVVVLIDRQQGGAARMASNGLRLHSAFTLTFILDVLVRASFPPAVTMRLRSAHSQGRGWLADVACQGLRIARCPQSCTRVRAQRRSSFAARQHAHKVTRGLVGTTWSCCSLSIWLIPRCVVSPGGRDFASLPG